MLHPPPHIYLYIYVYFIYILLPEVLLEKPLVVFLLLIFLNIKKKKPFCNGVNNRLG